MILQKIESSHNFLLNGLFQNVLFYKQSVVVQLIELPYGLKAGFILGIFLALHVFLIKFLCACEIHAKLKTLGLAGESKRVEWGVGYQIYTTEIRSY